MKQKPFGAIAVLSTVILLLMSIFFMALIGVMHVKLTKARAKNALQSYQLSGQVLDSTTIQTFVNKTIPGCSIASIPTLTTKTITANISCAFQIPFLDITPTFTVQQSLQ